MDEAQVQRKQEAKKARLQQTQRPATPEQARPPKRPGYGSPENEKAKKIKLQSHSSVHPGAGLPHDTIDTVSLPHELAFQEEVLQRLAQLERRIGANTNQPSYSLETPTPTIVRNTDQRENDLHTPPEPQITISSDMETDDESPPESQSESEDSFKPERLDSASHTRDYLGLSTFNSPNNTRDPSWANSFGTTRESLRQESLSNTHNNLKLYIPSKPQGPSAAASLDTTPNFVRLGSFRTTCNSFGPGNLSTTHSLPRPRVPSYPQDSVTQGGIDNAPEALNPSLLSDPQDFFAQRSLSSIHNLPGPNLSHNPRDFSRPETPSNTRDSFGAESLSTPRHSFGPNSTIVEEDSAMQDDDSDIAIEEAIGDKRNPFFIPWADFPEDIDLVKKEPNLASDLHRVLRDFPNFPFTFIVFHTRSSSSLGKGAQNTRYKVYLIQLNILKDFLTPYLSSKTFQRPSVYSLINYAPYYGKGKARASKVAELSPLKRHRMKLTTVGRKYGEGRPVRWMAPVRQYNNAPGPPFPLNNIRNSDWAVVMLLGASAYSTDKPTWIKLADLHRRQIKPTKIIMFELSHKARLVRRGVCQKVTDSLWYLELELDQLSRYLQMTDSQIVPEPYQTFLTVLEEGSAHTWADCLS